MRRTAQNTHGSAVAGAGATTATTTNIGLITLPAGGPWNIIGAWIHVVQATETAAELVGGILQISSPSGDVAPNPAPIEIPTNFGASFLGATGDIQLSPLTVHDLDLQAAGKAVISLDYIQPVTNTVAPQIVAGLIYGNEIHDPLYPFWYDTLVGSISAAALTAIGTITLSESAERIVGINCMVARSGVLVTAEELIGFMQLSSDDVKLPPSQWPFANCESAGLGALINQGPQHTPHFIPVDIPVAGGARIDCSIDLNTAITNAARVNITLAYR